MDKDMRLVRIYLGEADQEKGHNLLDAIMQVLHEQHRVQGVSVFRGIAGFGTTGVVHAADLLRLKAKLPVVIEFFDEPARVEAALASLQGLIPSGHLVSWPVHCQVL